MGSTDVRLGGNGNLGKSFWAVLDEPDRRELRRAGTVSSHPRGTTLFHKGDLSDLVLIIMRGSVKVASYSAGGHERLLAVRGFGDIVGEVSGIWRVPRSATVVAVDPVEILSIPRREFVRVLRGSAAAAMELIRVSGERRRHADRERIEFGGSTVARRVATVLIEMAARHRGPAGVDIVLPLTQEELAGLAATSRSGVARTLADLRARNVLATGPRRIILRDLDALRADLTGDVSDDMAAPADLR